MPPLTSPQTPAPPPTTYEERRARAKQEALSAWRGIEPAASIFGIRRAEYCLKWMTNVYGETFGLEDEI